MKNVYFVTIVLDFDININMLSKRKKYTQTALSKVHVLIFYNAAFKFCFKLFAF